MARLKRVVGPPGTGKTYWIQQYVENLGHRSILLVSHTRAAAKVLAQRVNIPLEQIGTLHSFGRRALGGPNVAETGKLAREWSELHPAWSIPESGRSEGDPYGAGIDGQVSNLWVQMMTARNAGRPIPPYCAQVYEKWLQFKDEHDAIDFPDMLELPVRRWLPPPHAPRVIVVDEAQDLTPLGWSLIRHWAQFVEEIVVAGDPAQTIYEWAGASPDPLLEDGWEEELLGQSYRLPAAVHEWAEEFLRRRHSSALTARRYYLPRSDGAIGEVRHLSLGLSTPYIVDIIEKEAQNGTVLILATCDYLLSPLLKQLRKCGIPVANPWRPHEVRWNPLHAKSAHGISTMDRIRAFLAPDIAVWEDEARLWAPEDFALWLRLLRADQFKGRGMRDKLLENPQGLDIDTVAESLIDEARIGMEELDIAWLARASLSQYRPVIEQVEWYTQQQGTAVLSKQPNVLIGTIHSVKGGEADTIILAPDLSRSAMKETWSPKGADAIARLLYVGATRARNKLLLAAPSTRTAIAL